MSGIILGAFICMAQYHFKLIQLENSIIDYWPVEVEARFILCIASLIRNWNNCFISTYLFILRKHFKPILLALLLWNEQQ